MSNRNILMLLQTEFPPDIRLSKEIKALKANGHTIHLLCNNNTNKPSEEIIDGAHIHRLPVFKNLPPQIQKIIRMPYSFNRLWIKMAAQIIKKYNIQSLHAHDLPMAPIGVKLAKKFNLKLVYDMHENYPAAMAEWNKGASLSRKIFKNEHIGALLDRYCIKHADRIIVVVDEMRDILIARGVHPDKVHVVTNTVDVEFFNNAVIDQSIIEKYQGQFIILYLGKFSIERGLETTIFAMPEIQKTIPNVKFLLVGGGEYWHQLQALIEKTGTENLVEYAGWATFDKVPSYMQAASICIVPQPSNPFIDTTIPHKLFQYMAVGKPVITSDAKPLKRIVEQSRCGEYFRSQNPQDFTRAVLKIHQSPQHYGKNGKKAVNEQFNWDKTASQNLLKLYNEL